MYIDRGQIKLSTAREATKSGIVDPEILIKSVRSKEYKNIIKHISVDSLKYRVMKCLMSVKS